MPRPDLNRVPSFYHDYINRVREEDLMQALEKHQREMPVLLQSIPAEKWDYRYAEGKWTIKELVQHVIDAERIFGYRALCIARQETIPLPGFDENNYAAASKANKRKPDDLIRELKVVQQSSLLLFQSFDEEQLESSGVANGKSIYVRAIGFIVVGHCRHHLRILRERYL